MGLGAGHVAGFGADTGHEQLRAAAQASQVKQAAAADAESVRFRGRGHAGGTPAGLNGSEPKNTVDTAYLTRAARARRPGGHAPHRVRPSAGFAGGQRQ
ncbi:hypothetical protein [Microtetraspora malaysiensis]|uniref:Uncharacterized protein n=1 Tax=Microtetraspora malaysiensis TaxID=161358 RepID=A0ABW6T4D6_9ACTN